jgi:hypothetical protein
MPKATHWLKLDIGKFRIHWAYLALVIAALLIAVWVQPEVVEKQPSLCLIKRITGKECMGCGMTRAFVCAVHGQFHKAYVQNKFSVIVFPLLGYIAIRSIVRFNPSKGG